MSREEIYSHIERELGVVPRFFKTLSDKSLESIWRIFYLKLKKNGPH